MPNPRRVVLISGSRNWPEEHKWLIEAVLANHLHPTDTVLHGGAAHVDTWAAEFAATLGCQVLPPEQPDYTKYHPKAAPKERNSLMVQRVVKAKQLGWDAIVIAFWHKQSGGTADLMTKATIAGLDVHCWTTDPIGLQYGRRTPTEVFF